MAHSKAFQFADPADINHIIAGYGRALGYPARVLIMRWLAEEGPKSAGEITKRVGLSKATVSQHLSRLERVGIIMSREEGNTIIYEFNTSNFKVMREYIDELLLEIETRIGKEGSTQEG